MRLMATALIYAYMGMTRDVPAQAQVPPDVAGFNYSIGTQTFGPAYRFTQEDAILESSKAILEMGSSIIKAAGAESREDLLALPFRTYFSWFDGGEWQDGVTEREWTAIRDAAYAKARSLLTRFNGTGRTFFLGHWEGDWLLLGGTTASKDPSPIAIQGMVDWLNARQRGIDDAKKDTPHENVAVWQYTEVNRVRDAMLLGRQRVVNSVLPRANVDFVSYSAYDIMRLDQAAIDSTLDYVAGKLTPKPGLDGKRVFIGEFGISADETGYDGARHEKANRDIMVKFLDWGCPYVLYWQMYNNEIKEGEQRGFWLIDDKAVKQPLYQTYRLFLAEAKAYVAGEKARTGRVPPSGQYLDWAAAWLSKNPSVALARGTVSNPGRSEARAIWGGETLEFGRSGARPKPEASRFRINGAESPIP